MSKTGDSSTTTTSGTLPSYIEPYITDLLGKAQDVSNTGYQTYEGDRLAGFSSDTETSFDMMRDLAAAGTTGVDDALGTANATADYAADPISTEAWTDADQQAYMDPYLDTALQAQEDAAYRRYQEQAVDQESAAVAAGAYGGDRRFVEESLALRDYNEQQNLMQAEGWSDAYSQALSAWQADTDRALSADVASEEARRLGEALGLDAATVQGALEQQKQDMTFRNIEGLSAVGSKIQGEEQAGLDIAYQDWLDQTNYPAEQLSLYSQLLAGVPVTTSSEATTTASPPDFLSQLLGLGTSAAGIYDLLEEG